MADVNKGAYTNPFTDGETRTWDIVNEYDWTSAPAGSKLRSQTPNAYVTAYKMEFSQLQQFIDGYINIGASARRAEEQGTNPGLQFYKDLYKSSKVLADINFPFFSDSIRGFSTEYTDSFSPISQRGAKFLFGDTIEGLGKSAEKLIGGTVAGAREFGNVGGNAISEKVASVVGAAGDMVGGAYTKLTGEKMPGLQTVGAPGSFIETPKFYQYSNTDEGVVVEFVLSNTLHDYRDGPRGFKENIKFIKDFTMMNRPYREGPIEMTFPAIYHIEIPGLRYIEWASLESFGIQLIGARRRIGKDIIPEAYGCKFLFKSLTIEAANFVQKTDQVAAFDDGDASYIALRKKADEGAEERVKAAKEAAKVREAQLGTELAADEARRKAEADAVDNGEPVVDDLTAADAEKQRLAEEKWQSDDARNARLEKARAQYEEANEAEQAKADWESKKDLLYDKDRPDLPAGEFQREKDELEANYRREQAEADAAAWEAGQDPLVAADMGALEEAGKLTTTDLYFYSGEGANIRQEDSVFGGFLRESGAVAEGDDFQQYQAAVEANAVARQLSPDAVAIVRGAEGRANQLAEKNPGFEEVVNLPDNS